MQPSDNSKEPVTGQVPIIGSSLTPITASIPVISTGSPAVERARQSREIFGFLERVDARLLAVVASTAVGIGPVLMLLSGENAATTVLFRFGIALIPLAVLAIIEWRMNGPLNRRHTLIHLLAGVFFGIDLGLWTPGMMLAGAGVATVAGNIQVIIVPLFALIVFRERIGRPFLWAIPVMLTGIVLISGALEQGALGPDVLIGVLLATASGFAYAGYVLIVGRAPSHGHAATQAFLAAFMSMVVGTSIASLFGAPNLTPEIGPLLILIAMALFGQVIGWMGTTAALPRLETATGSTLLLVQPLVAVLGGLFILGEHITWMQWAGIAAIIAAVWFIAMTSRAK